MPSALIGLPIPCARRRRVAHATLLAIAIAVAASPALAQQPSPDYMKHYNDGQTAFHSGDYATAKAEFEKAIAANGATYPGAYRWLASVGQATSDFEACLANAVIAVKLNPNSTSAPTVRKIHAECRASMGRPAFRGDFGDGGAIVALTNVDGATVMLNGLRYGATPMEPRAFAVGVVAISVERKGYLAQSKGAEILAGMVTDVVFELEVDPNAKPVDPNEDPDKGEEVKSGWLIIKTTPATATISFDGKPVTLDDSGRIVADAGLHVAIVEAPGHEPWRRRVRVNRGQSRTVDAVLRTTSARASTRKKGYLALGVAGALGLTGAVFGILEMRAFEEANDIWDTETRRPTVGDSGAVVPIKTRADLADARDRGRSYALISGISYGAAAVALGASIYFFIKERPADREGLPLPVALTPIVPAAGSASGIGAQVSFTTELDW